MGWKTVGITAGFAYAGLSKHSIIKTCHIYTFCLVNLYFHCSSCVGESIVGRAVILPVYLALHCTKELQEQSQIFQESHLPAEARLKHQNRAPGHSPQFLWWLWPQCEHVLRKRGLVQENWWGCSQKDMNRLDKRLKEGKGKPKPNPTRCVKESKQNGAYSRHPLKIPLKLHWQLLQLWRGTSYLWDSF